MDKKFLINIFSAFLICLHPTSSLAVIPFGFWRECANLNSQSTPNWSNVQAYFRLNEATTGTAPGSKDFRDYSGNGNHATKSTGVTMNQAGKLNKSVLITGGGSNNIAFSVPGIDTVSGHSVTVMFWMNWNGVENSNGTGFTVAFGFTNYSLAFSTNHDFGFCTTNNDIYGVPSSAVPSNTWVHVAVVMVGQNITSNKIYINGLSQTLSQQHGTPATGVYQGITTAMQIGNLPGNPGFSFQGNIDEFAVFNGALSASDIAAIYNQQKDGQLECP